MNTRPYSARLSGAIPCITFMVSVLLAFAPIDAAVSQTVVVGGAVPDTRGSVQINWGAISERTEGATIALVPPLGPESAAAAPSTDTPASDAEARERALAARSLPPITPRPSSSLTSSPMPITPNPSQEEAARPSSAEPQPVIMAPAPPPSITSAAPPVAPAPDPVAEAPSPPVDVASLAVEEVEVPVSPINPPGEELLMSLNFEGNSDTLSTTAMQQLLDLAGELPNLAGRLQVRSYAGIDDSAASASRRLSFKRALAVRSFLIEQGVRSTRVDLRALGPAEDTGPAERVDIFLTSG